MAIPVLTAVSGAAWEATLVAALEGRGRTIEVVRRCVDVVELLAAAGAGSGRAVLLSADLRRLDRDVVTRLRSSGVAVVGIVAPGDPVAAERLAAWGVTRVVAADAGTEAIVEMVVRAVAAVGGDGSVVPGLAFSGGARPVVRGGSATTAAHETSGADRDLDGPDDPDRPDGPDDPNRPDVPDGPPAAGAPRGGPAADLPARQPAGRVIAVWGPTGAPGRTTVASALASELAASGLETLIIDADVYGGVLAAHLGVLDESPGLAAATRMANAGTLDIEALLAQTLVVADHLSVLTGIARADRWPEIRPSSLEVVLQQAREVARVVVVDCAFNLEEDEELSFDTVAPRRNGATLTVLAAADTVLAVAGADPVGLQRLVRGLDELAERVAPADLRVVVNRLRRGAIGPDPQGQIAAALERFAGVVPVAYLPEDRAACDAGLLRGRTVPEAAPDSRLRKEIAALARDLAADVPGAPRPHPVRRS